MRMLTFETMGGMCLLSTASPAPAWSPWPQKWVCSLLCSSRFQIQGTFLEATALASRGHSVPGVGRVLTGLSS